MISPLHISTLAASVKAATGSSDPYWSNVSLLLHGETLTDSSSNALTLTNNGATINTTTYKYGSGSLYFNGSSHVTLSDSELFNFSSSDFTIEFFFNPSAIKHSCFWQQSESTAGYYLKNTFYYNSSTSQFIFLGHNPASTPVTWLTSSVVTLTANTWVHVALVRNVNNIALYLNGSSIGSATLTVSPPNVSAPVYIGKFYDQPLVDSGFINGYIDEFRITKGVARYTANFTPPTQAFPNS